MAPLINSSSPRALMVSFPSSIRGDVAQEESLYSSGKSRGVEVNIQTLGTGLAEHKGTE